MKRFILFFALVIHLVLYADSYTQMVWSPMQSNTTQTINAFSFYGSDYGFYCGSNGVIAKTT
ncbi:MAG: hypothetical protein WC139_13490, partial [Candidatus Kapaibacterium sp.]